jgi:thiamine biosynthesis lipoprotein
MWKKTTLFLVVTVLLMSVAGCSRAGYEKFSGSFFDSFDTYTTIVGYFQSEEEFDRYFNQMESRLKELHKLFDKFNSYDGINNIKTINDNAGVKPIQVEQELIDLILFSKEWYQKAGARSWKSGRIISMMLPMTQIMLPFLPLKSFKPYQCLPTWTR